MQKLIKIVLIALIFLIGSVIAGTIKKSRGDNGYGFVGISIIIATVAGARAIWAYESDKPEQGTTEIDKLNKS